MNKIVEDHSNPCIKTEQCTKTERSEADIRFERSEKYYTKEQLEDYNFLRSRGWVVWNTQFLIKGKKLLLCYPPQQLDNVPYGTVLYDVNGNKVLKGIDPIGCNYLGILTIGLIFDPKVCE